MSDEEFKVERVKAVEGVRAVYHKLTRLQAELYEMQSDESEAIFFESLDFFGGGVNLQLAIDNIGAQRRRVAELMIDNKIEYHRG